MIILCAGIAFSAASGVPVVEGLSPEISAIVPEVESIQNPLIPEPSILTLVALVGFALMFRRRVR